jgi:hypothetical protein
LTAPLIFLENLSPYPGDRNASAYRSSERDPQPINDFELGIDPTKLTIKDLNRLIAYNRYKNKGILINLVKKGVLKKK